MAYFRVLAQAGVVVFRRFGFLMIFLALLAGCSPDYNWREVAVADGAVQASFSPIRRERIRAS